jgi:hypothetical protein
MPDLELETPPSAEALRDEFRTTNVSSKLTRSEAERLDNLADERGLQRGELIRELILREIQDPTSQPSASLELIELVGLRMILTNLLRTVSQAQPITQERFDAIMTEVRRSKVQVATDLAEKTKGGR